MSFLFFYFNLNGADGLFLLYVSTRVGLVLTGSSIFALVSYALQHALLGPKFNWTSPSVFSGVRFCVL